MGRYLRLYISFLRFSFSKAMEFRVDFFFRVIMDGVFYATQIGFFSVLYGHTQELGGWNLGQTLIFISGFFLVDALHMTIFANNMWMFPILVNKGDLDYYLVRPVSSLFFISLREFAANSFLNVLLALGICIYALATYSEPLGAGRIALYILLLLNGMVLYFILHIAFLIPVFWMHSARGLGELFFSVSKYCERPERIFDGYLRRILVSILPMSLVASRPAQQLFDGADAWTLLHLCAVTVGGLLFLAWFWKRALRSYSSASS
ncbi:MAG: ABC-2 type transport system permease protein [Candidatus Paceibacteria bacterium]|jgi:ABC-2 type transport system permease protein